MSKKLFSEEEIAAFRSSPYTEQAAERLFPQVVEVRKENVTITLRHQQISDKFARVRIDFTQNALFQKSDDKSDMREKRERGKSVYILCTFPCYHVVIGCASNGHILYCMKYRY